MQLSRYWYWSLIFGTASCVSLLFHDLRTQHFVSVTDFVTILYEAFITNVDILQCFVIKFDFSQCFALNGKFWIFTRSIWTINGRTRRHFHTRNQPRKAWKRTTETAALQAFRQIQVGQYDVTLSGLTADHLSQNDGWQCQILGFFRDQFLFKLLFQIIHFLD